MGCLVDVSTALVAFLVAGDWITRNSRDPGKVYIMIIGLTASPSYSRASIESRLKIITKKNEEKKLAMHP